MDSSLFASNVNIAIDALIMSICGFGIATFGSEVLFLKCGF